MMKVFVSSTYVDLVEYRKKTVEVLLRYKYSPLAMEYFGSRTQDPETVCENEISECDIFIGIYAHRFGFVPDGREKSITQMEYELAKQLGKKRLCFVVKKGTLWDPDFIEIDKYAQLQAFLGTIKKDHAVDFFTNPDDFAAKLAVSLANAVKEQDGAARPEEAACKIPAIPAAPLPYLAHPYALPQHFTGREAEMAVLSNWFHNEGKKLLVMEAIGGMGKSALSWVWLQKHVLAPAVETDGVFWWSFYDEPFESFIRHLACYVMGGRSDGRGESIDLADLAAILQQRRFLLVLDGLERVLRGYAGLEAMFIQENRFAGDDEA
ncbi:MAG: DUF4062 domain-containing protein, partial [bacterium]|nr:DUF4062 domain-containing protein [bacterium]